MNTQGKIVGLEDIATGVRYKVEVRYGVPMSPDSKKMMLRQEPVYGAKGNMSRSFWRDPNSNALFVETGV